jgi:S-DNA-T family DNA segregation ATPase FtsK/SpoIIIE
MSQKIKKKRKKSITDIDEIESGPSLLRAETIKVIYALVFFLVGLFLLLAAIDKAGPVGLKIHSILSYLLGVGYYLLPVLLFFLSVVFVSSLKKTISWVKVSAAVIVLLTCLSILSLVVKGETGGGAGGLIGNTIADPLYHLFDLWVSLLFLLGVLVIAIIITVETHIKWEKFAVWRMFFKEQQTDNLLGTTAMSDTLPAKTILSIEKQTETFKTPRSDMPMSDTTDTGDDEPADVPPPVQKDAPIKKINGLEKAEKVKDDFIPMTNTFLGRDYTPPPMSLLEIDKGKPGVGDIKANANIIKRTLQNFGINVEMDEISIGPSVTRYALKPAEGVKLSRIVGLQNDLSLALAAHPIRIEAPIPGKSLVGIEIPNTTKTTVGLATLFGADEFRNSDKPLLMALGKGISGKSYFGNLAKMPHVLIAGATGSGKSVTIHALLTSLLYRNSPENLKFIMIDPKRVELTMYNNIPHLLTPVITDAKKAILALKWAGKEMDRRYDVLQKEKVRDIESYHKNVLPEAIKAYELAAKGADAENPVQPPEMMPYLVVIIDEMADLMQAYPRELESAIVRLAQMSRAVGIHLILSTQRPSVNVITGLIKANVPSRIALQVTSQIDSRTILDTGGAEKLLGAGDMLYMSGDMSKPQRIQSAYLSEVELKNVVKYLIDTYADMLPNEINLEAPEKNSIFESSFDEDEGDSDDLYEEARTVVMQAGKASTSYLQRKLRIGYARAARLVDMLEERGVIGPGDGAKPREVIGGGGGATTDVGDDI